MEEEQKPRIIENPVNLQYGQTQEEVKITKRRENFFRKMKRFWIECKRVLKVTKKPDGKEFKLVVKISAIGMAVLGIIGFILSFLKEIIFWNHFFLN